MTSPDVPPYDTGNAFLGAGPAQLTTAEVMTPGGKLAAVTIRTASTTLTVFLNRDDVQNWAQALQSQANQMTGLLVVPAGTVIAPTTTEAQR